MTLAINRMPKDKEMPTILFVCNELDGDVLAACAADGIVRANQIYTLPNGGPLAPMNSQYDLTDEVLTEVFSGYKGKIELVIGIHEGCVGLPPKSDGERISGKELKPYLEAASRYYEASIEHKSAGKARITPVLITINPETGSANVTKDVHV